MTEPFKLVDLMPALAAKMANLEEHRKTCTEATCLRCHPELELRRDYQGEILRESYREEALTNVLKWIPPAYAEARLDAEWLMALVGPTNITRASEAVGAARVAFIGAAGAGKSSLCAAMYRAVAKGERSIKVLHGYRWVSSHKLAKARAMQRLGEGEAPLVQGCLDASLLVLDELGGEDPRYASAVTEILYERHEQARPTWITTGVGPKEIGERYGGGIARRVFEDAVVFQLRAKT